MPRQLRWNAITKQKHDRLLRAAVKSGGSAATTAIALEGGMMGVHHHSRGITEAATGRKWSGDRPKPYLSLILPSLHEHGHEVLTGAAIDISAEQLRKHRAHLNAVIQGLKVSSERASALGKQLMEVHRNLREIRRFY